MKRTGSFYSLIVFMVICLVFIGLSLRLEYSDPKLLPILVASIAFILAGIGLRQEMLARDKPETEDREGWRRYMVIGAWIVGFTLAIYMLGFIIASALFLLSYMKSHGARWLVAVTVTILIPASIYSLFELALGVTLYQGVIF